MNRPIPRVEEDLEKLAEVDTYIQEDVNGLQQQTRILGDKLEQLLACLSPPRTEGAVHALAVGDDGGMTASYECGTGFYKIQGSSLISTCTNGAWTDNVDLKCMHADFTLDEGSQLLYRVFSDSKASFEEAKKKCKAYAPGGRLVVMNSNMKWDQILFAVKDLSGQFWIGAERSKAGTLDHWIDGSWINEGYWRSGEPNNYGGYEGCGILSQANLVSGLNDVSCENAFHFICEVPYF